MKRAAEQVLPLNGDESSVKQQCLEDTFASLDETFTNMDFTFFESLMGPIANIPNLNNQVICVKELSEMWFLRAELFRKSPIIHIRKFIYGANGELQPTREGITMNLKTFYEFSEKFFDFNLIFESTSFICNNRLCVLNVNGEMILKDLVNSNSITLNYGQHHGIRQHLSDFCDSLTHFVIEYYFPALIASKLPINDELCEEKDILNARFIHALEIELSSTVFKNYFICEGCILDCNGQLSHSCITTSDFDKFEKLKERVFLLVDFENILCQFVENTSAVSTNFLLNFDMSVITAVLFKSSA